MAELFQCFPHLMSERLIIRKMTEDDIDSLSEIINNENVYRYIPLFLYKKSRDNLLAAIRNLGGRNFDKKKWLVCTYLIIKMVKQIVESEAVNDENAE